MYWREMYDQGTAATGEGILGQVKAAVTVTFVARRIAQIAR